jgi:hypothetical protein
MVKLCDKCGGDGWLWWNELEEYYGPATETGQDDNRYSCDRCMGTGRFTPKGDEDMEQPLIDEIEKIDRRTETKEYSNCSNCGNSGVWWPDGLDKRAKCDKCNSPMPRMCDVIGSQQEAPKQPEKSQGTEMLDELECLLEEVYQWLHEGPLTDWDKRCDFHRRIGKALGKPPVEYHE